MQRPPVEITVRDEESLVSLVMILLKDAIPISSFNSDGVADCNAVEDVMDGFLSVTQRAFARYARERNMLVPINRWPPEILAHVASFLPFSARENCLRVCHRWHEILSSERYLWDRISVLVERDEESGARQLAAMLKRNAPPDKSHPVTLDLQYALSPSTRSIIDVVQSAMAKLRELRVYCGELLNTPWTDVLKVPAPLLQVLVLAQNPTSPALSILPQDLFAGQAPRLHVLDLSHIGLPVHPLPALSRVTNLSYTVHITMCAEIVRACDSCPRLEELTVRAERADLSDPPPGFTPPRLKRFTIRGSVQGGYQDAIVLANRRNSRLDIWYPLPGARDATLSGVPGLHALMVT
ncbi:hypothetical protein EXIGLDRAFT_838001 [Exidia glandulosa HHB12029]|uniref:F-box domain-containing protein n=1 Tax=Exidia glandulosa HHB12029 TaxID=1314781 RepID=A0A165G8P9_EXIGL|nr:hypothetical protein EXIGLDRAFT_838001 [Exidia glandulosa HHB12029]